MARAKTPSNFVTRFDRIWAQARRVQLSQALCWGVLSALVGVALLVAVDYAWELPRVVRLGALVAIAVGSVVVAITLSVRSVQRWQRQATAAVIEEFFPQLGQRIRTTVQYGDLSPGQIEEEGVATTLVGALEDDTVRRAQPLPLDAVVPWKRLALASLLAAVVGLGLAGASAVNWEWRTAAQRTFLGQGVYTRIVVAPGDLTLKEGESATVQVTVEGRTGKAITFWSRRTDEEGSEWSSERLAAEDAEQKDDRSLTLEVPLDRVRHPLEYRVTAGSSESNTYHVNVLYPLKMNKLQAAVQSPAYTGLPEQMMEGGNITGLAGSQVTLRIELDRPAQSAWLEVRDIPTRDVAARREGSVTGLKKLPLLIDGNKLMAAFDLTTDQTFSVLAKAADGMELPENKQRIRVRQDEPPQVWFESPAEALEVHSLAEIVMRIRVSDDFGLTRAGIMFEVNNEEEYPLLMQDFSAVQAAEKELKATGKLSPQTRATLEKVLPLEHFKLNQQDSVMYYAFAEDNRPGKAHRTESELRFIDIRPFRRLYRVFDSADGMPMNQGPQLKTLEELIARQRYALNRTLQLAKQFKHSGQPDLAGVDSLIKFEGELAKFTRELAKGLEARGINETELLYQAETAMLAATDSLSQGNYDTATLQQRDALKYLIEGRNRLQVSIQKNPNRQQLAQLRQFDRMQQQKLRRPKTDEEEAREVAERLKELADQEDFVYKTLAGVPNPGNGEEEGESGLSSKKKQPSPKKAEGGQDASGSPKDKQKEKAGSDDAKAKSKEGAKESAKSEPGKTGDGNKQQPGKEPSGKEKEKGKEKNGNEPGSKEKRGKEPGSKETGKEGPKSEREKTLSPRELEDRQQDVAAESREVEKLLAKVKGITDLAKERMAAAAKSAEASASALNRGATDDAQSGAKTASGQFRELAEQVKALMAQEQAAKIAAAQKMAAELAQEQRDFADRLANKSEDGSGGDEAKKKKEGAAGMGKKETEMAKKEIGKKEGAKKDMPGLGGQAEKIADRAKTLADVLGAAARAENPEDQASAKKVQDLMGSLKLPDLTDRLQKLPGQVGKGQVQDAKVTAADGAERMEATAEQLAALHRSIVAPKVDELAKLTDRMTKLDEDLEHLDAPARITGWHMDADKLLEDLDKVGVSKELRDQFQQEMKKGGWGPDVRTAGWPWARAEGGYYTAPAGYRVLISRLLGALHGRMQELMLSDLAASRDEPIPPQYQELVDRFHRILASEGKDKTKRMQPQK